MGDDVWPAELVAQDVEFQCPECLKETEFEDCCPYCGWEEDDRDDE